MPRPDTVTHRVVARNLATRSSNRMHDDTVARRYGFAGGLVPGADVWAYMSHPLVELWGEEWLAAGTMEVRFRTPFYDGDEVTVRVETGAEPDAAAVTAFNAAGVACATGRATRSDGTAPPLPAGFPSAPLPEGTPPPASTAWFESHPVLGTLVSPWTAEGAVAYLDAVGEHAPPVRDRLLAPPGWLARLSDLVLVANVTLGPWIFAQARMRHLGLVRPGDVVETRARTAALYERSGHRFVELDLLMLAGDRAVACARKVAIHEPRRRDG